jgi:hypothetical protein
MHEMHRAQLLLRVAETSRVRPMDSIIFPTLAFGGDSDQ